MTAAELLAERVREFLIAENLTQDEFAERFGVSQATVSQILKQGRGTTLSGLDRLAEVMGVRVADLFTSETDKLHSNAIKEEQRQEHMLLSRFRALSPDAQDVVLDLLARLGGGEPERKRATS